jgi:hypothetical protein
MVVCIFVCGTAACILSEYRYTSPEKRFTIILDRLVTDVKAPNYYLA